jgi:hypothetical protein
MYQKLNSGISRKKFGCEYLSLWLFIKDVRCNYYEELTVFFEFKIGNYEIINPFLARFN